MLFLNLFQKEIIKNRKKTEEVAYLGWPNPDPTLVDRKIFSAESGE
jgi:hypothetical protein